jgi:lipopolysaccharide/colanic/teichoic acid biosynthesis glycosyltransferase
VNSIIDHKSGLFTSPYFHKLIKGEKSRTHRTNLPFSLILIDVALLDFKYRRRKNDKGRIIRVITQVINDNSRETDLKGWFDRHTIAVLLPDTSHAGAEVLCNKLISLGELTLIDYLQNGVCLKDCFAITSYPEVFDNGGSGSKAEKPGVGIRRIDPIHLATNNGRFALRHGCGEKSSKSDELQLPVFPYHLNGSCTVRMQKAIKRLMDIIGSLLGIILFLPAFVGIVIAVKLTSPGPVFFKQKRVGLNRKTFTLLKFRSMYTNCDQSIHRKHIEKLSKRKITLLQNSRDGVRSYKLQDDPRITKIGRFLRQTSLDELPQLFNVVKGEMSLVGPRPYPVYQIENCTIWQHSRLTVKPGITGLAQLRGRCNTTYDDSYRLDLEYVKKWSLWLDFKILIKTVPFALSGRGAV